MLLLYPPLRSLEYGSFETFKGLVLQAEGLVLQADSHSGPRHQQVGKWLILNEGHSWRPGDYERISATLLLSRGSC